MGYNMKRGAAPKFKELGSSKESGVKFLDKLAGMAESAKKIKGNVAEITGMAQVSRAMDAPISKDASSLSESEKT